jgi:hypothetical protein
MKTPISKKAVILFMLLMITTMMGCFPAVADEIHQEDTKQDEITLLPVFTETRQSTKTQEPTISPTLTESPLLIVTSIPTITPTFPMPIQATNTNLPVVLPTSTKQKHPTLTVTPTPSKMPTGTSCLPPTAEPFWVDPVISPTDQLSQIIKVYIGHGKEVTVTSESGTFTVTGNVSSSTNPALVQISLLPGVTHHLEVSARIRAEGNGCIYSYVLKTWMDKQGAPLEIVQGISYP